VDLLTFTGIIVKDAGLYSALCPELDVASFGDTEQQAKDMLLEAATLHLEGAFEDGVPYLRPISAEVDPRSARPSSAVEVFQLEVGVDVRAND
jgi:predicted RNase H-like HicB family nuclease